jgi:hypothetical protein
LKYHANPAVKLLDSYLSKIFEGQMNVPDQPPLEEVAIATLEGQLVVVDNRAVHGGERRAPQGDFSNARNDLPVFRGF